MVQIFLFFSFFLSPPFLPSFLPSFFLFLVFPLCVVVPQTLNILLVVIIVVVVVSLFSFLLRILLIHMLGMRFFLQPYPVY